MTDSTHGTCFPIASWLQCIVCGSDLFEPDEDGLFWDGTDATCQECGVMSSIHCDDHQAYVSTDELVEDVGQPRCDNACGLIYMQNPELVAEFMGSPCKWDCERTKTFVAQLKMSGEVSKRIEGGEDGTT